VVEPDYYRRALRWDSTAAVAGRSAKLAWSAAAGIGALDPDGRARVTVRLRDHEGQAITDAVVRLTAIHNRDAARRLEAGLTGSGDVYVATLPLGMAGLWELRLEARRGDDLFVTTLRRDSGAELAP
jgi:hypothetical protein